MSDNTRIPSKAQKRVLDNLVKHRPADDLMRRGGGFDTCIAALRRYGWIEQPREDTVHGIRITEAGYAARRRAP